MCLVGTVQGNKSCHMTCQAHLKAVLKQAGPDLPAHLYSGRSPPAPCTDSATLGKSLVLSEPQDPLMPSTSLP